MKIFKSFDVIEIKKIVEEKAKYQKIACLYDSCENFKRAKEVCEVIKDICVFNQLEMDGDLLELNNGYKMILYFCSTDSFLKTHFNKTDFINVYIPSDGGVLPYYIKNEKPYNDGDFLFLYGNQIDAGVLSSICFCEFFDYLSNLIFADKTDEFIAKNFSNITQKTILDALENCKNELYFIDVKILKESKLCYRFLPLVDYVLITALYIMITAVNSNAYSLVDFVKATKNDENEIDKFYAMANNVLFKEIVELNFLKIASNCKNARENILQNLTTQFQNCEVEKVIESVKVFCKKQEGLLGYLYLFNIFKE